jgi:hypothetical protein
MKEGSEVNYERGERGRKVLVAGVPTRPIRSNWESGITYSSSYMAS